MTIRFSILKIIIVCLFLSSCSNFEKEFGTMIIHGGIIYTVDSTQATVEAVVTKNDRILFAGNFEEELGNVLSATFEKQNSLNFDVCKGMSNNKYYNVSDKVINLTSQTEIQTN